MKIKVFIPICAHNMGHFNAKQEKDFYKNGLRQTKYKDEQFPKFWVIQKKGRFYPVENKRNGFNGTRFDLGDNVKNYPLMPNDTGRTKSFLIDYLGVK